GDHDDRHESAWNRHVHGAAVLLWRPLRRHLAARFGRRTHGRPDREAERGLNRERHRLFGPLSPFRCRRTGPVLTTGAQKSAAHLTAGGRQVSLNVTLVSKEQIPMRPLRAVLVLIAVLVSNAAAAQVGVSIQGLVLDGTLSALPGATVTATNPATGIARQVV